MHWKELVKGTASPELIIILRRIVSIGYPIKLEVTVTP